MSQVFGIQTIAFIQLPGHSELLILLVLGLLLFGKRLPEVGRSLGRSIVEFKRGVKGIQDEIEHESAPAPVTARPPLTAGGQDVRVGQSAVEGATVEPPRA